MPKDSLSALRLAQLESARGAVRPPGDVVRLSWQSSAEQHVELAAIGAEFVGHLQSDVTLTACAARLLGQAPPTGPVSVLVADANAILRTRLDADPALGRLLDSLALSPGHDFSESLVGTTALSVALQTAGDAALTGPEHYHPQLGVLAEAASVVTDAATGEVVAAVVVVARSDQNAELLLPYAQLLAIELTRLVAAHATRSTRAVFERFLEASAHSPHWVVASDGGRTFLSASASSLDPADLRVLSDSVGGSLLLAEFQGSEIQLPSGTVAETSFERVLVDGSVVGSVLSAGPCLPDDSRTREAVRRQGAHVTSSLRRDYALDLPRADHSASEGHHRGHPAHPTEGIRDTRDLMTPFLRARHDVAVSVKNHRNHLVIGEAGAGKQSLVIAQFRAEHADGRVLTADCTGFTGDELPFRSASGALFHGHLDDGPYLLYIGALETLSPVGARRLDDILRPLAASPGHPLLVGSINDATVDASKPYGLVMRYFYDTVRVPPLRLRVDDIGDLALGILGRLAGGRSLRLSHQAIRVLEGYSWPGNVSELEDVLKYVASRKPVGEVQARDLPAVCFTGGSRRLSMLESAQRDAIIQALYEAKGNRYKAAAALGIARSSLYRKIDSLGISYIA